MANAHIQRSVRETTRLLLVGFGALALTAYLITEHYDNELLLCSTTIILPMGLYSLWQAWARSYVAACPSCGAEIDELSPRVNDGTLCDKCFNFVESTDGVLAVTAPNRVADKPIFGAPLFAESVMPAICSLCTQPPTRRFAMEASVVVKGQRHSRTVTIGAAVPYCGEHEQGVRLGFDPSPRIFFRSHHFLREFCRANNAKPVSLHKRTKR